MQVIDYFRRRMSFHDFDLEKLSEMDLPYPFLGFIIKYRPLEITSLLTSQPHAIGFIYMGEVVRVSFIDAKNLHKYEVDYGESKYREDIIKIAENNITEGGIFYDISNKCIYNFLADPVDVPREHRKPVYDSMNTFLESLRLYKLSNDDIKFKEEWKITIPENKDLLLFPWES